MRKNIGNSDKFLRIIAGILALIIVMGNVVEGTSMWIFLSVGLIMVVSSSLEFCPAYALFGINTCKKNK